MKLLGREGGRGIIGREASRNKQAYLATEGSGHLVILQVAAASALPSYLRFAAHAAGLALRNDSPRMWSACTREGRRRGDTVQCCMCLV